MNNRAGKFINTGKGFKAFSPTFIRDIEKNIQLRDLYSLIDKATSSIGELRALETLLPNPELLLRQYSLKEALLSSEIEGTQSTLIEVIENQNKDRHTLSVDIREVINYQNALKYGIEQLKSGKLPLCLRLLKNCHAILMNNVRGGEPNKTKGEFRISQNWIGGKSPSNAIFVPPTADTIQDLLSDLELYIHKGKLPELVKIALLHYQFETIHPFLDGNGRIGRLLITLYLIDKKILNYPTLYLSLYLKKNRTKYYDNLTAVREGGGYEKWIKFFLEGIISTSLIIMKTTKKIQNLQETDKQKMKKKNEYKLLDFLFKEPLLDIKTVEKNLGITNMTANSLIKGFEKKGILKQINKAKRYKKYIYKDYIEIIDEE